MCELNMTSINAYKEGKTHFEIPILFIVFHITSLYFYLETLHPCTFIFI